MTKEKTTAILGIEVDAGESIKALEPCKTQLQVLKQRHVLRLNHTFNCDRGRTKQQIDNDVIQARNRKSKK